VSRRIHALIVLLGAVSALGLGIRAAPVAIAASPNPVITDCNDNGRLTKTYTEAQLKLALSTLPPEIKQYTNCLDVINRALLAALSVTTGTGTGGGGSGGSFLPTPVIVVIVLLALAGATFGALAVRRRREQGVDSGDASEPPPDGGDGSQPREPPA
jgi:hypothetical protein